jgi:hypothetical protein
MPDHSAPKVIAAASRGTALLRAPLAVACASLTLVFVASAQAAPIIDYANFTGATGLQLNGVATIEGATVRLTPNETYKSGTMFSKTEIETSGSFETEFELWMHESTTIGTYNQADGMAFVLQPQSAEEVGEVGGSIGYAGIKPSAVVQFDIYRDPFDPEVPYISFMENGEPENHLAESGTLPFSLYSETTPVWAWVEYDASTHALNVYAAPGTSKPAKPATALVKYTVNLVELLGTKSTFVGFTAGTGAGDAKQEVLSWQLSGTAAKGEEKVLPPPPPSAHGSATQVICNLIVATASDTCIATVGDTDVPAAITPTGTVTFTSSNGGVFSAGSTCNLVPTPNSPDTASCSVQFLPPTGSSSGPAITASYPGDAHHGASAGKTFYPSAGELSGDIELSGTATTSSNGTSVEEPVTCAFPCSTSGELISGPDTPTAEAGSLASLNAGVFIAKSKAGKKKHKAAKTVVLGTGNLTLGKAGGGKGTLVIKLNAKAKRILARVKGKPVKGVLVLTVRTLTGTLVKTERKTITIRPHPKAKKHGKRH